MKIIMRLDVGHEASKNGKKDFFAVQSGFGFNDTLIVEYPEFGEIQ